VITRGVEASFRSHHLTLLTCRRILDLAMMVDKGPYSVVTELHQSMYVQCSPNGEIDVHHSTRAACRCSHTQMRY
jgi:hypothetical protein